MIVSTEVLEHLKNPQLFVDELYRVQKPAGVFFLTTRFIHEIHGEDYFRYTKLSLETLFKKFTIVNVEEQGSIFSLLWYLIAFIFPLPLFYNILSLFYSLIATMDNHGTKRITLGYSIYGKK